MTAHASGDQKAAHGLLGPCSLMLESVRDVRSACSVAATSNGAGDGSSARVAPLLPVGAQLVIEL